jgi:hypothetical protein
MSWPQVYKAQGRNSRIMGEKNQGNVTPLNDSNSIRMDFNKSEVDEMPKN